MHVGRYGKKTKTETLTDTILPSPIFSADSCFMTTSGIWKAD